MALYVLALLDTHSQGRQSWSEIEHPGLLADVMHDKLPCQYVLNSADVDAHRQCRLTSE